MPKIIIRRRSEFANQNKTFTILLDGKKLGTIADGETKEFEVTAGNHALYVRMGWFGSSALSTDINGNDKKIFETGAFKAGSLILPIFAAIVISHFMAKFFFHIQWILALSIPLFFPVVYYLTKGRNQYLTLSEIE